MRGSTGEAGFTVAMARASDTPGIDIIDPIERRRCTLLTDGSVSPRAADPATFRFPVETAVEVETTGVSAPFTGHVYVRDETGEVLAKALQGFEGDFSRGTYHLELSGLIKVYLHVEGAFTVRNSTETLEIAFEEETTVTIGSRSLHTRPATTVTTTADPTDILAAISTFGSALKTVSPERSFPTWRGHPPAIELGEERDIPTSLTPPVTDVHLEVPPRYEYVYPAASLAYYLGIAAEPGNTPRLVGPELDYSLAHRDGYERGVQEVLQRVFLLECATRTEGIYPVDLYERDRIEDRVDLPFEDLYDASVAERLRAYLAVPFATVEDVLPDWRLAAHVEAAPDSAEMLPYLANELALITMATPEILSNESVSTGMAGFTRGGAASETRGGTVTDTTFVRPQGGPEAIDTAWVSGGTPVNATKAVPEAYENRFGRTPQERDIEIAVVCNSSEMDDERMVVDEVYGSHEKMSFDVEMHEGLTTDELAELLGRDFNFLHYIGHIDQSGFRCADGRLDLREVEDVAPEAFFLNACQSYDQGLALIEGGAIGGIVTLNDVVNHGAVRIGKAVARLLNTGFPLRSALDIASNRSVIGRQYVVVGDGTLSIVQPPSGTPQILAIENLPAEQRFGIEIDCFGAPPGMGCMYIPYLGDNSQHYLAEGRTEQYELSRAELVEFLHLEDVPVATGDEIQWSPDVRLDDL